jgi:hypothetical protein
MTENSQFSGLTKRVNQLAKLVLQNRIASALDAGGHGARSASDS